MSLDVLVWIASFIINIVLLSLNFYQVLNLSDLEEDYINPFDFSSRSNSVIVIEFILHGVFCIIFLLSWHWAMFLITVPIMYYNLTQFLNGKHVIYATEIFRTIREEKRKRVVKIGFYALFFIIVVISNEVALNKVMDKYKTAVQKTRGFWSIPRIIRMMRKSKTPLLNCNGGDHKPC